MATLIKQSSIKLKPILSNLRVRCNTCDNIAFLILLDDTRQCLYCDSNLINLDDLKLINNVYGYIVENQLDANIEFYDRNDFELLIDQMEYSKLKDA